MGLFVYFHYLPLLTEQYCGSALHKSGRAAIDTQTHLDTHSIHAPTHAYTQTRIYTNTLTHTYIDTYATSDTPYSHSGISQNNIYLCKLERFWGRFSWRQIPTFSKAPHCLQRPEHHSVAIRAELRLRSWVFSPGGRQSWQILPVPMIIHGSLAFGKMIVLEKTEVESFSRFEGFHTGEGKHLKSLWTLKEGRDPPLKEK